MAQAPSLAAADLLRGALWCADDEDGWVLPQRLAPGQLRALGSVRAWHPGLFRQMAACTAGVCVAFSTDGHTARVEVRMGAASRPTRTMLADVGRAGGVAPEAALVSVEVDGRPLGTFSPGERDVVTFGLDDAATLPSPGMARLPGMGEPHEVRVWLPCLLPCAVRDVSVEGATYLGPASERDVLLVLGDSIAQGFTVGDAALTWPALLAKRLGLDLVNQGIGGQVFQPGSLPAPAAVPRVAAVVVEFADNYRFERCSAAAVRRDARAYLAEVASAWPDTPTAVVTTPPHTETLYPTHPASCAAEVDALISEAAAPHAQMRLVDGSRLLPAARLGELLADGSDHPGAEGQRLMARALERSLLHTRHTSARSR